MIAPTIEYTPELTCSISVRNIETSKRWYAEVLGFQHLYTSEDMGWCELATVMPGINIGLSEVEHHEFNGSIVLSFGVKDMDQAIEHLKRYGTKFDGDVYGMEGVVKLVRFRDPDGNLFMLSENVKTHN